MGEEIQLVAALLEGEVRPRWTGWEVRSARARVLWTGGIRGVATRIVGLRRTPELLSADGVMAALEVQSEVSASG